MKPRTYGPCPDHPEIIAEGYLLQWEWMSHDESITRRLLEMKPEEEEGAINDTMATITRGKGKRPGAGSAQACGRPAAHVSFRSCRLGRQSLRDYSSAGG